MPIQDGPRLEDQAYQFETSVISAPVNGRRELVRLRAFDSCACTVWLRRSGGLPQTRWADAQRSPGTNGGT